MRIEPRDYHVVAAAYPIVAKAVGGLASLRMSGPRGLQGIAAEPPPPRLLGAFEPVLLGWTSREPLLGSRGDRVTVGGLFRAFALVRGRAAGTWTLRGGEVALELFGRLGRADRAALEADAADVLRFLTG